MIHGCKIRITKDGRQAKLWLGEIKFRLNTWKYFIMVKSIMWWNKLSQEEEYSAWDSSKYTRTWQRNNSVVFSMESGVVYRHINALQIYYFVIMYLWYHWISSSRWQFSTQWRALEWNLWSFCLSISTISTDSKVLLCHASSYLQIILTVIKSTDIAGSGSYWAANSPMHWNSPVLAPRHSGALPSRRIQAAVLDFPSPRASSMWQAQASFS